MNKTDYTSNKYNKETFEIPERFYFHGNEINQYIYVQVPLALIKEDIFKGISDSAKLLYALLLNRTGLSYKNGWTDENDRTYIIYTIENVQEDFGIGSTKAKKLFAELSNINNSGVGLIKKKRILNKPSHIYVMNFKEVYNYLVNLDNNIYMDEFTSEGQTQVSPTDGRNSDLRTDTSTTVINNYISNKDYSDNYSINHSLNAKENDLMDEIEEIKSNLMDNIEYDILCDCCSGTYKNVLDEILDIMVEVSVMKKDVEIGGNIIPFPLIKSRFEKYNMLTMQYVLESISNVSSGVKNVKKYLLATLYNAPLTMNSNYKFMVQKDIVSG